MLFKKFTVGVVEQTFNDQGECIHQRFLESDEVNYETEDGDDINVVHMPLAGKEYFPFLMVQPENGIDPENF